MTQGIVGLLETCREPQEAVARWVQSCTLCGSCSDRCPEGLDPVELLYLAKPLVSLPGPEPREFFATMAWQIRLLALLQITSADFRRLSSPLGWGPPGPEVLFYFGCNVLRMPDLLLAAIDILYRIGIRFAVLGGVGNCCGIVHYRLGDLETAERIENATFDRWLSFEPERVLLWCPNCEVHFRQTRLWERRNPPFKVESYAAFLASRRDELARLYRREIRCRVVLHEHRGHDLDRHVRRVLESIPGLEIVEVPQIENWGYVCGLGSQSLAPPEVQRTVHRKLLEEARRAGVGTIVTSNQACQMSLCGTHGSEGVSVRNFVSLVGEALGIEYPNRYGEFAALADARRILAAAGSFVERNRLDPQAVEADILPALAWGR
jgi:heterodisulfide reductase subunit D